MWSIPSSSCGHCGMFRCGVLAFVLWWLRYAIICLRDLPCGRFNSSPCVVNIQVISFSCLQYIFQ